MRAFKGPLCWPREASHWADFGGTEVKAGRGRRGRKPWVLVDLELTQTSICLAGLQRAFWYSGFILSPWYECKWVYNPSKEGGRMSALRAIDQREWLKTCAELKAEQHKYGEKRPPSLRPTGIYAWWVEQGPPKTGEREKQVRDPGWDQLTGTNRDGFCFLLLGGK